MQSRRLPAIRPGYKYDLIVTLPEWQALAGDGLRAQLRRTEYDAAPLIEFTSIQDYRLPNTFGLSLTKAQTKNLPPGDLLMDLVFQRDVLGLGEEPITDTRFIIPVNLPVTSPGA